MRGIVCLFVSLFACLFSLSLSLFLSVFSFPNNPPPHSDPQNPPPSPVPHETQSNAFTAGRRIESKFQNLISSHMKPLKSHQFSTQFFHPTSVAGLFVNANATYVIAFLGKGKKGMRMKAKVPEEAAQRPYYGIMTVDYVSAFLKTLLSIHFSLA